MCHRLTDCVSPLESDLYPYGDETGDVGVEVDVADGNSPYITPPMGFPFMGKLYHRVYVSIHPHIYLLHTDLI